MHNLSISEKKRKIDFHALHHLKSLLREANLHTVCEEAKCPNIVECFGKPTATFLIMGDICTRNCTFCAIKKGIPVTLDSNEPKHIADVAKKLKLKHVVITSVTRDDLSDGGANHFAKTVKEIKKNIDITVEVLVPDFKGNIESVKKVIDSGIDIFNHNLETIPELYSKIRPMADYNQSLSVLKIAKKISPNIITKSGIMVGFDESIEQVKAVLDDLSKIKVDIVTIGQYFRPAKKNVKLSRLISEDLYNIYKEYGEKIGIPYVFAGTYVRSSYNAEEVLNLVRR